MLLPILMRLEIAVHPCGSAPCIMRLMKKTQITSAKAGILAGSNGKIVIGFRPTEELHLTEAKGISLAIL